MNDMRTRYPPAAPPAVVRLPAELDTTTSGQAARALAAACVDGVSAVIADLTQTTFCDSSGIRALLVVHKLAASRGIELHVAVSSEPVLRILELTGLTSVLRLYPNVATATAA